MSTEERHLSAGRFQAALRSTIAIALLAVLALAPLPAAAKYAALIIDATSGEVLHSVNADTRNHPASLTKMMTLYKVFEALDNGDWTLDTKLEVSKRAAGQPASKLGLRTGTKITVDEAIKALAVKSANDVATVIAENYSGSEREFAREMTATARWIGMSKTTFKNASGLPNKRQLSTARDMALLARALLQHFPHYYHFFSEKKFAHGGKTYRNHNKLLKTYDGTDGIKTGYIRASGFNLVASVERGGTRLIGVVFGGKSPKARNRQMAKLLDKGFRRLGDGGVFVADAPSAEAVKKKAKANKASKTRTAKKKKAAKTTKTARRSSRKNIWGVQVGAFRKYDVALSEALRATDTLPKLLNENGIHIAPLKKRNGRKLHRARIYGLTKREAFRACKLLERRKFPCLELRAPANLELAELPR